MLAIAKLLANQFSFIAEAKGTSFSLFGLCTFRHEVRRKILNAIVRSCEANICNL